MRDSWRTPVAIAGVVLVLLGSAAWIAPVIAGDDALTERTVETKRGDVTTTETSLGWGALHSDEMLLALLGAGFALIALGSLQRGRLKSISTIFGDFEFDVETAKQVAAEVASKAPEGRVEDVYERALRNLAQEHGVRALEPPSRASRSRRRWSARSARRAKGSSRRRCRRRG